MIRQPERFDEFLKEVRSFVHEQLIPEEARLAKEKRVPAHIVAEMARRNMFGYSIPDTYGGLGMTSEELVLAAIEVSQCSVAFRLRVGSNTGIGSEALVVDGTDVQKEKYLPRMATGDIVGAFAITEPDAGSDASALRTTAIRDGDHYVINGSKCFITNAVIADVITVMARTEPSGSGSAGVSAILVDRGTEGMTISEPYETMGQQGVPVSDVIFLNCRVPVSNLIGQEHRGFQTAMKVLNKQRLHLAGLCIGPAIRMLEDAVNYVRDRKQFGQALAEFQLVQAMIADCQTEIYAARALVLETARKRDAGEDVSMEASMCKYFASEMCGRVADRCVQMLGGNGYRSTYPMERFYRDVRAFRIYEGTSQIHQLTIAKRTLARAAERHVAPDVAKTSPIKETSMKRRRFLATAALPFVPAAAVLAETAYPNKPIRMVVGYAPGGATDLLARLMADKLSAVLGQPVIVENRPGASGNIGTEATARAPADGYTLMMGAAAQIATNPSLFGTCAPIH